MHLDCIEVDPSVASNGINGVANTGVGDGQCGAREGFNDGGGASFSEDSNNPITKSTFGSILTWIKEAVEIVQMEDQGGVSNSVGTAIYESVRP